GGLLAAVAMDRARLEAEPPGLDVGLLDLLHRRLLRHVMVLEIAPEMKGCTAAIMRTWPSGAIDRAPRAGRNAQSKTDRSSIRSPGAPSMVSCSSMYSTMLCNSRES